MGGKAPSANARSSERSRSRLNACSGRKSRVNELARLSVPTSASSGISRTPRYRRPNGFSRRSTSSSSSRRSPARGRSPFISRPSIQRAYVRTRKPARPATALKSDPEDADWTTTMAAEQLPDFDELLAELGRLESEERRLSTARRKLHNVIDGGFVNDVTRRRERQISQERLELHRRIDILRGQLAPVMLRRS